MEVLGFCYCRWLIDLRSFGGWEKWWFSWERWFGVCCNGRCSCMDELVGVDDDRTSGYFSARVVAVRWISHIEWQILLATGMPTVTLSRSWFLILCFNIIVETQSVVLLWVLFSFFVSLFEAGWFTVQILGEFYLLIWFVTDVIRYYLVYLFFEPNYFPCAMRVFRKHFLQMCTCGDYTVDLGSSI